MGGVRPSGASGDQRPHGGLPAHAQGGGAAAGAEAVTRAAKRKISSLTENVSTSKTSAPAAKSGPRLAGMNNASATRATSMAASERPPTSSAPPSPREAPRSEERAERQPAHYRRPFHPQRHSPFPRKKRRSASAAPPRRPTAAARRHTLPRPPENRPKKLSTPIDKRRRIAALLRG